MQRGTPFQSTPSAWRETISFILFTILSNISIHSLRMEGDFLGFSVCFLFPNFNPLPPHGGRLAAEYHLNDAQRDFNPLPPHGGRRMFPCSFSFRVYFNPLPPHGGRRLRQTVPQSRARFQSTPSAWRETSSTLHNCGSTGYFNPLPPHGGRRKCNRPTHRDSTFQSTPSAWRETNGCLLGYDDSAISIHSLRMEGDNQFL